MQGENTLEDHRRWEERGKERRERYFWSSGGKERAIPERGRLLFSFFLSLFLGGREAARTEGNELSRQSSFSRSHFVLTLLSPPFACVYVYRQPIPTSASSSFPCFPIEAVRKTRFFVPPLCRKCPGTNCGERKGEWRKGKEGANGEEFPPRGLITGSQGKKEEEREREARGEARPF